MIDRTTSEKAAAKLLGASAEDGARLRDLLPFTIGNQIFAVFADQVETTAEARPAAPLPRAPATVVGLACVHGHMITVLDPTAMLTGSLTPWPDTLPFVLVLRGNEQIGLVAESCRDTVTISAEDIEPVASVDDSNAPLTLGRVVYAGEAMLILDTTRLFRRAVQRRERRRRRF